MRTRGFEYCKNWEGRIRLPVRGTATSAGYDFFCPETISIGRGETVKVITGIKAYMQPGEVLMLFPRSSLGIKKDIILANTVGVVDADYYNNPDNEGNIIIALKNNGNHPVLVTVGERIAQGVFLPFLPADNEVVLHKERIGGIGSTNK